MNAALHTTCAAHAWCNPTTAHDSRPPTEHHAPPTTWRLAGDANLGLADELTVQLHQIVDRQVRVRLMLCHDDVRPGLVVGDLDASQARELGELLLKDAARIEAGSNRYGRGVQMIECLGCSHDFHPDSSPHLDRCWSCAELADAEAGAR